MILSAMKYHLDNAQVQHYGCAALQNLAMNDNNKVMIAETGGIPTIVSAMKYHSSNINVQHYGCAALGTLAVNDNNKKMHDCCCRRYSYDCVCNELSFRQC